MEEKLHYESQLLSIAKNARDAHLKKAKELSHNIENEKNSNLARESQIRELLQKVLQLEKEKEMQRAEVIKKIIPKYFYFNFFLV